MNFISKSVLKTAVASSALALSTAAVAQTHQVDGPVGAAENGDKGSETSAEIIVTGTRIRQDGYNAPVPVAVLGPAEIKAQKPANIADLVYTMPAVSASSLNSQSSSTAVSAGNAGINTINLRGLGAGRTLVLLNGHRIAPSTFNGLVDVNTIPQDLIERVEVVTGGASAQYGSDAIGGVVNFILDDDFKGLRLGADTSITTYGDGHNYRLTGTAGLSFLDNRLHILLNGEYFNQDAIKTVDRPWNETGYQMINNPAYTPTNGEPERLVGPGIGFTEWAQGGIIQSGPLRGTLFLGDGVTRQLNYGVNNSVSSPWMIGGDWQATSEGAVGTNNLMPEQERIGVFSRVSFDVAPDITVYGQFSWNRDDGRYIAGADPMDLTISANNGFLLTQYPQVAAAIQANGLNSIPVGSWAFILGTDNSRTAFRYAGGAKGKFTLSDRPWSWDVYYQHGVTKTHEETVNLLNNARFAAALDSVVSNGQVVCRSTLTDSSNGCVPVDLLGTSGPSAASLGYIFGPEQPWREQRFTHDVVSASLSGELLDLPGGSAAIAFGGEWRNDRADGEVGATSSSGWRYANYKVNRGKVNVKEAFLEVALPIFTGFSIDAAGRYTDYSTSGSVKTWKVGAIYSPISDIKFRGAYSHDIRAPNMSELFLAGTSIGGAVILPPNAPAPGLHLIQRATGGNPNLQPEKANTLTAGVVLTPRFLPGFSASIDYYDIKIKDTIGTVGAQRIVDFCYEGVSGVCENIIFSGNTPVAILEVPVNFASQRTKGFDIEASYSTPLSAISNNLPGNFRIHAAAAHVMSNVIDNRIFPVDYAGVNYAFGGDPSRPNWSYRISAFYEADPVTINLVARGFSSGVYSNEWVECASNCPPSTSNNRTINNNRIAGAIYFSGSVSHKIRFSNNEAELTFIVNNIFNRSPTLVGMDESGFSEYVPQTSRGLYDILGRVFRVAFTTKF